MNLLVLDYLLFMLLFQTKNKIIYLYIIIAEENIFNLKARVFMHFYFLQNLNHLLLSVMTRKLRDMCFQSQDRSKSDKGSLRTLEFSNGSNGY